MYAGFWRRVAAYIVDSFVLLIPGVAINLALEKNEAAALLAQTIMWWLYKSLLESGEMQGTLGKKALGIKVTDLDGERVSFGRATGRFFGVFLSALLLGIGLLMAAFTARRQALHDAMAGCLVVKASASPAQISCASGTMPATAGVWLAAIFFGAVPVVGILAAIAIPAYQDYTIRAKMTEAVNEGTRWKSEAAEKFWAFEQNPTSDPYEDVTTSSKYVNRVILQKAQRAIYVEVDGNAFPSASIGAGSHVRLQMSQDGASWSCDANGIPNKYLPAACRQ